MPALTITQFAKELNVKRDRIYEYIKTGEIKAFRLKRDKRGNPSGGYRIPETEKDRFIAVHTVMATPLEQSAIQRTRKTNTVNTGIWHPGWRLSD